MAEYKDSSASSKGDTQLRIATWQKKITVAAGSLKEDDPVESLVINALRSLHEALESLKPFYRPNTFASDTLSSRVAVALGTPSGEVVTEPADVVLARREEANQLAPFHAWVHLRSLIVATPNSPQKVELGSRNMERLTELVNFVINEQSLFYSEHQAIFQLDPDHKLPEEIYEALDYYWWLDFIDADSFTAEWAESIRAAVRDCFTEQINERLEVARSSLYLYISTGYLKGKYRLSLRERARKEYSAWERRLLSRNGPLDQVLTDLETEWHPHLFRTGSTGRKPSSTYQVGDNLSALGDASSSLRRGSLPNLRR